LHHRQRSKDRKDDSVLSLLIILIMLVSMTIWGFLSARFQSKCKLICGDARALTPISRFEEVCLCDEGHGRLRRIEINSNP
jgi:hypothetical protein